MFGRTPNVDHRAEKGTKKGQKLDKIAFFCMVNFNHIFVFAPVKKGNIIAFNRLLV